VLFRTTRAGTWSSPHIDRAAGLAAALHTNEVAEVRLVVKQGSTPVGVAPEELRTRLRGVLAFAPTPFDAQTLELDLPGLRRNLEFLVAGGIEAVAVAGVVGEYSALNAAEYRELLRTAREVLGPTRLLVAGIGVGSALAMEYAAAAEEHGADCVMLLPPYLAEPTDDGLVAYTEAVAGATRLGIMLHSTPGYPFASTVVERLAEVPAVIAYKDELGDVRAFTEIVDAVGERLVYVNGRAEPMMGYYAAAGANVLASAIASIDPAIARAAFDAAVALDFERLRSVLAPMAGAWYRFRERNRTDQVAVSKASMNLLGLSGGRVRPPLSDLRSDVQAELRNLLIETNYLKGAS
jgi:5-dehydro-4-deoxyglucarate dehydratase